ncbi:MAG: hypothetical protein AAF492_15805, partial [Verrucomicrobiota bacterium]
SKPEWEAIIRELAAWLDANGWEEENLRRRNDENVENAMPGLDRLPLPPERATNLKILRAWRCKDLKELTGLPRTLEELDLRNAGGLEHIDALPETLTLLDLARCARLEKLPRCPLPNLTYLYLGGCASLPQSELDEFLDAAGCSGSLKELELPDCPRLNHVPIERLYPALRRLTVSGCVRLESVPDFEYVPALRHLNAQDCPALVTLPPVGPDLQYLALFGSRNLKTYMGHDLNARDLGVQPGENVAPQFHMRRKVGRASVDHPRCKLMFLGNGRSGKTTLAKAIQYYELRESERDQHPNLEPTEQEDMTHPINLWNWVVDLPDGESDPIERARIRIWDFGGQETYHGAHRIFAASGSLFVVTDPCKPPPELDPMEDIDSNIWQRLNLQRPISYWLDYIFSLGSEPRVIIVHTQAEAGQHGVPVTETLLPHQRKRVLGEFYVGCLSGEERRSTDFDAFHRTLKSALHRQVTEEGRRIPEMFERLLNGIESTVAAENPLDDEEAILSAEAWADRVREAAEPDADLDETDLEAITGILHQAGDLFQMSHEQAERRDVIIDQSFALDAIYGLLHQRRPVVSEFRRKLKYRFGLFDAGEALPVLWP